MHQPTRHLFRDVVILCINHPSPSTELLFSNYPIQIQNHTKTKTKMMNVLAITLVLSSLFAAALWSPSPSHRDEVIVKDGHRMVVVEYDKEAAEGRTKVLISPPDVVPSEVDSKEGTSNENKPAQGMFSGPRELVCDAYGKCKHKMASAIKKTKDKVEETVHGVSDKAQELEEHAKTAASDAIGKGSQGLSQVKDRVTEKVTEHTVGESVGKAKDTVSQGVDKAKKVAGTVKDGAVDSAKETVENVQQVGEKSLNEIFRKIKDVANDVFWYMVSRDKVDAVAGLIHMLGYSTAYGMCVWVTFISSYILGRYLPKQQFGLVQSRIYPVYFKAMAYCVSAALLGHLASGKTAALATLTGSPGLSLLSALLMVLANMILLEPRATKTMYERMKTDKEEGRGVVTPTQDEVLGPRPARGGVVEGSATVVRPTRGGVVEGGATMVRPTTNAVVAERQDVLRLNDKLKRLNTYSSILNVLTLVALTWHMAYMGQRLHATN
ncbi:hypothetical protein Hdeb2414_s0016g00476701 [Helianthus debilis subsp. tardiflorus]